MVLWGYCLWFAVKYDKNSKYLILLILLNVYYSPFYFFRMKRIKRENKIKKIADEIYDSDFIKNTRDTILDVLNIWSSKDMQIDLQQSNENQNITEEIFQQWDINYKIDNNIKEEAFSESHLELLESFNKAITLSQNKFEKSYPKLDDFQKSNDWIVLNKLAKEIKKEIK
jgi:hypothetical protein